MDRIFVVLPSAHERGPQATVNDLFIKASHPDRIVIGVCMPASDSVVAPPGIEPASLRVTRHEAADTAGACGWRHAALQLHRDEEYIFSIESQMRFIIGWDVKLLAQLKMCDSARAVLSHYPAYYVPPNVLEEGPYPTYLKAAAPSGNGEIRIEAERLAARPPKPIRGAFVSVKMLFAKCEAFDKVPFDPYIDEEQTDISFSLRLFTHGFDVYSPRHVLAYHLPYDEPPTAQFPELARQRFAYLRGAGSHAAPESLIDIETYGLGEARSLPAFEEFSGLDLRRNRTTRRAEEALFIPELALYTGRTDGSASRDVPARTVNDIITFAEDVLKKERPIFDISSASFDSTSLVRDAPPGVLILKNYLDRSACERLIAYAERQKATKLGVNNFSPDGNITLGGIIDGGRVTEHVPIDGIACDIINLFNDIYCNRVAPFYRVDFQYYERPQFLRYPIGGEYRRHADSECWNEKTERWIRTSARDYSVVLYVNDAFEGGEFEFTGQQYRIKPEPGMLVAFPSDHRFMHAALPTTSGIRYALVTWAKVHGTPITSKWATLARVDIHQQTRL